MLFSCSKSILPYKNRFIRLSDGNMRRLHKMRRLNNLRRLWMIHSNLYIRSNQSEKFMIIRSVTRHHNFLIFQPRDGAMIKKWVIVYCLMKEFPITEQFESSKVSESNQAKYQEVPKLQNLIFFENPEQKTLTPRLSEIDLSLGP